MSTTDFRGHAVAAIASNSTAYTAGDMVGGKLTLTGLLPYSGGRAEVVSVTLSDLAKQNNTATIVFFSSDPSGTTFTNNSALDIADADLVKVAGIIQIAPSNFLGLNDNSVGTKSGPVGLYGNGTSIVYACMVAGAGPTYGANALQLTVYTK